MIVWQSYPAAAPLIAWLMPRLSEEHFWRNYFYRVSLIKQSFGVNAVATGRQQLLAIPVVLRLTPPYTRQPGSGLCRSQSASS